MIRCIHVGCTEKVVGGFAESLAARDNSNPYAPPLDGLKTAWCKKHEQAEKLRLRGKKGRLLGLEELQ
jgi:hypothetical protein